MMIIHWLFIIISLGRISAAPTEACCCPVCCCTCEESPCPLNYEGATETTVESAEVPETRSGLSSDAFSSPKDDSEEVPETRSGLFPSIVKSAKESEEAPETRSSFFSDIFNSVKQSEEVPETRSGFFSDIFSSIMGNDEPAPPQEESSGFLSDILNSMKDSFYDVVSETADAAKVWFEDVTGFTVGTTAAKKSHAQVAQQPQVVLVPSNPYQVPGAYQYPYQMQQQQYAPKRRPKKAKKKKKNRRPRPTEQQTIGTGIAAKPPKEYKDVADEYEDYIKEEEEEQAYLNAPDSIEDGDGEDDSSEEYASEEYDSEEYDSGEYGSYEGEDKEDEDEWYVVQEINVD